jgi:hypothetical protein
MFQQEIDILENVLGPRHPNVKITRKRFLLWKAGRIKNLPSDWDSGIYLDFAELKPLKGHARCKGYTRQAFLLPGDPAVPGMVGTRRLPAP